MPLALGSRSRTRMPEPGDQIRWRMSAVIRCKLTLLSSACDIAFASWFETLEVMGPLW